MDLETFFENFDLIAEAPNGVAELRKLILQLAVQGKLVPQDPNDEPASVLLTQIDSMYNAEKNRRDQKPINFLYGKKKEPNFRKPTGWEIVTLGRCIKLISGQHLLKHEQNTDTDGLPYLTGPADFRHLNPIPSRWTTTKKVVAKMNDILITVKGAGVGKINILSVKEAVIGRQLMAIRSLGVNSEYLYVFLMASYDLIQNLSIGSTVPGIGRNDIINLELPIPPILEQHRIVAKVQQLMSRRDELESHLQKRQKRSTGLNRAAIDKLLASREPDEFDENWQRIRDNFDLLYDNPENVDKLKQGVLQLAVQGKIVPQDPNEEPASVLLEKIKAEKERLIKEGIIKKQKPLLPIDANDAPFELPSGWELVPLGEIVSVMDAGWSPACNTTPSPNNNIWGILKTTSVQVMNFLENENKELPANLEPRTQYELKAGDILITRAGPKNRVGVSCLVHKTRPKLMISDKTIRFRVVELGLSNKYISLCLNAGVTFDYLEKAKSGMAESQMNISQIKLKSAPIPLCPVAEQHRIVAKVDYILALCDELVTQQRKMSEINKVFVKSAANIIINTGPY